MNRALALILVVGWSVLAALGVTYSLLVDFIALYHLGDGGPYGILFDYKHVTVLSAFPAQLMTTYAFMGIGRKAGFGIELLVTLALWFTAIGVWRSNRIATRFATSFFALQGRYSSRGLATLRRTFSRARLMVSSCFLWR